MLQYRKPNIFSLLIVMAAAALLGVTNGHTRSVNDADYLTIIVDETMRNLLKQCNKSVIVDEESGSEYINSHREMPITMKDLTELMEKTVRTLSDTFTTRLLQRFPKSCADILPPDVHDRDGVYSLHIYGYTPINVYCLSDRAGDGGAGCPWTMVQRRQDKDTDFNLRWTEYKAGFGDPYGSFFLGMEAIYWLLSDTPHELRIVMRLNEKSAEEFAHYDHFAIGDEGEQYALKVLGKFSGNAKDELTPLKGYKFRTRDRTGYCPGKEKVGGWWKEGCAKSKLHGIYAPSKWEIPQQVGIIWDNKTTLGMNYSLSYVHMAIRPKFCNLKT